MFSEKVIIGSHPSSLIEPFLSNKKHSQIGVLVDEHTAQHCYLSIKDSLPAHVLFQVPSGEENKTLTTCSAIWQHLTDHSFDRHSLLIIVGGGVLGDMGGFCAATYKRGIDFVLMPTTLLSQVDASVGGKLGIDFHHYKNHIGVFQEPAKTLIATDFLSTLPERELRSGFAEIIKHCLIADREMWDKIRIKPLKAQLWNELIPHSVAIKYRVIEKDPKEKGLRKILNFGHTLGHAIETHFLVSNNKIFHGEAIAIGMIAEGFMAHKNNLIAEEELTQLTTYLVSIFGKVTLPNELEAIIRLAAQDKKNKGNEILLALPSPVGKAQWDVPVTKNEMLESLRFYQTLYT